MAFATTHEVLDTTEQALGDAGQWLKAYSETTNNQPELQTGLQLARREVETRRDKIRDLLQRQDSKVQGTHLQFARPEAVQHALHRLQSTHPDSVSDVEAAVGEFLQSTTKAIQTCQASATGTPAGPVFDELNEEFQASTSHLAWSLRPSDDSHSHDSGITPDDASEAAMSERLKKTPEAVATKVKETFEPEPVPADRDRPWLPFSVIVMAYMGALLGALALITLLVVFFR